MTPTEPTPWTRQEPGEFLRLASKCTGSAGVDGWDYAPWVLEELVDFFDLLTVSAPGGLPEELVEAVYGWRIVGIPKRNSNESRPIAVASVLVR